VGWTNWGEGVGGKTRVLLVSKLSLSSDASLGTYALGGTLFHVCLTREN